MERKFILALSEHRMLGYVFHAYLAELQNKSDYYILVERIILDDVRKRPAEFSDDQKKIVKLIEEYSDTELSRVYSRKKLSNQEFISSLTPELLNDHIRPHIERRLIRIIEILKNTNVEIFFKDSPKQIYATDLIIHEKQPAEAVFNFIRTPEEFRYFLTVSHNHTEMKLTNRSGIILVNTPCHIVIDNRLLRFNDIDGKKLNPFFRTEYVMIPKASEKDYLEKFVSNSIKNYKVNCSGFSIEELRPKPTCILSLEANLEYIPVLRLSFQYENKYSYNAGTRADCMVTLENNQDNYVFYKLYRDARAEQQAVDFLKSLGLKQKEAFFLIDYQPGDSLNEMLADMIHWINTHERIIAAERFSLVQTFFDKKYYTHTVELTARFQSKEDWFDVYAMVTLGEYEIPFVRFRKHILTNNREYKLPNGEFVILPKEWFSRFSDLFLFGKIENGHILYRNMHLPVLQESFATLNPSYKDTLLDLNATFGKNDPVLPPGIHAVLRPYQLEGFSWMYRLYEHRLGGCLADDMGLGKTIQTLSLLLKVLSSPEKQQHTNETGLPASLIVLPSSLIHNWYNEIQKFTPELRVLKYIGTGRSTETDHFNDFHIILTTYGVVRNEYSQLQNYEFLYLILDESQTIKNPDSKIFTAVTELNSRYRLVLTGTPIENSLTDLWSQIEFINPGLLGDLSFFKTYFSNPIEKDRDEMKQEKLKRLIQPFILRRTKQEVATDLPELTDQVLYCSMSDAQKSYYEEEKSKVRNEILHSIEEQGMEKSSLLVINALIRMRQIANHPSLIDANYMEDSGKFEEVTMSLESMYEQRHKVLIFSSFVKHLNLFRAFFEERGWIYSMLTGETRQREEVINDFQTNDQNLFFLISLKAGGVGLNLTAADYVFILDPWWNPAAEMQAINRAHRIGQTSHVFVYRFISAETIEDKIIKLQEKKSELAEVFINSNNPLKSLSRESILELFD